MKSEKVREELAVLEEKRVREVEKREKLRAAFSVLGNDLIVRETDDALEGGHREEIAELRHKIKVMGEDLRSCDRVIAELARRKEKKKQELEEAVRREIIDKYDKVKSKRDDVGERLRRIIGQLSDEFDKWREHQRELTGLGQSLGGDYELSTNKMNYFHPFRYGDISRELAGALERLAAKPTGERFRRVS